MNYVINREFAPQTFSLRFRRFLPYLRSEAKPISLESTSQKCHIRGRSQKDEWHPRDKHVVSVKLQKYI